METATKIFNIIGKYDERSLTIPKTIAALLQSTSQRGEARGGKGEQGTLAYKGQNVKSSRVFI